MSSDTRYIVTSTQAQLDIERYGHIAAWRDEERSNGSGSHYLLSDIPTLEEAAESLLRTGETKQAVALWALALRIRQEVRA